MKRLFDIVFSTVALLLMLPVLLIASIVIKVDSTGSLLYRGLRTGRYGRPFWIYKFRSMKVGQEKPEGDTTAFNDPRITRVGAILRKYKIDELPQLVNVLKGEMSVVGPRPELAAYTKRYTGEEQLILSVRPGITDYSSIEFRHLDKIVGASGADRVFEEKILPQKNALRVKYVKTHSFWRDLIIICRTVASIFKKPSVS